MSPNDIQLPAARIVYHGASTAWYRVTKTEVAFGVIFFISGCSKVLIKPIRRRPENIAHDGRPMVGSLRSFVALGTAPQQLSRRVKIAACVLTRGRWATEIWVDTSPSEAAKQLLRCWNPPSDKETGTYDSCLVFFFKEIAWYMSKNVPVELTNYMQK